MTASVRSWADVVAVLRANGPGTVFQLAKGALPHPRTVGMRPTVSLPQGQVGEWIWVLPEGGGLHVFDLGARYHAELATLRHLPAPFDPSRAAAVIGGCAAAGAVTGAATGRSNGATLAGALLGGLVGAALLAAAERENAD